MEPSNFETPSSKISSHIHWGHFGLIVFTAVALLGLSYMEKPQLFSFKNNQTAEADQSVPHYYAYVPSADDQPQPEVLGASTDGGPQIIGDDGTVQPVDMGEVLGASTQDVVLTPGDIKVNTIPDSTSAITNYLSQVQTIENGPIDDADFEAALSSNDQDLINTQANKLVAVRDNLLKLSVPQGFTKWQQLNVIQYNTAIGMLQNFTDANQNPELVAQDLEQFLKSQQDLQTESSAVATKYNLDASQLTTGLVSVGDLSNSQPDSQASSAPISASQDSQANIEDNAQQ